MKRIDGATWAGIGYALLGALCMAAMDAAGKAVVLDAPIAQTIALRAALVLVLGIPMIRAVGWGRAWGTNNRALHLLRIGAIVASMLCFLSGLRSMNLATASAIGLSAPLFMIAFARPILGEVATARQAVAAVIGFAGVLVVSREGLAVAGWGPTLLVTIAAACFGLAMVLVRRLARADGDATMLLWTNGGVLLVGGFAVPATFAPMSATAVMLVGAMALLTFIGQIATYRAFRRASVAVLAPTQYFELIFAAAFGWLAWREAAGPEVWLGGALIVAGSVLAVPRRQAEKA